MPPLPFCNFFEWPRGLFCPSPSSLTPDLVERAIITAKSKGKLDPSFCDALLSKDEADERGVSSFSDGANFIDEKDESVLPFYGLPKRPLYRELTKRLRTLIEFRISSAQNNLFESGSPTLLPPAPAPTAQCFELDRPELPSMQTISENRSEANIVNWLHQAGIEGISHVLGLRKTVHTVHVLPPSWSTLLEATKIQHSSDESTANMQSHITHENKIGEESDVAVITLKNRFEDEDVSLIEAILANAVWINIRTLGSIEGEESGDSHLSLLDIRIGDGHGARWTGNWEKGQYFPTNVVFCDFLKPEIELPIKEHLENQSRCTEKEKHTNRCQEQEEQRSNSSFSTSEMQPTVRNNSSQEDPQPLLQDDLLKIPESLSHTIESKISKIGSICAIDPTCELRKSGRVEKEEQTNICQEREEPSRSSLSKREIQPTASNDSSPEDPQPLLQDLLKTLESSLHTIESKISKTGSICAIDPTCELRKSGRAEKEERTNIRQEQEEQRSRSSFSTSEIQPTVRNNSSQEDPQPLLQDLLKTPESSSHTIESKISKTGSICAIDPTCELRKSGCAEKEEQTNICQEREEPSRSSLSKREIQPTVSNDSSSEDPQPLLQDLLKTLESSLHTIESKISKIGSICATDPISESRKSRRSDANSAKRGVYKYNINSSERQKPLTHREEEMIRIERREALELKNCTFKPTTRWTVRGSSAEKMLSPLRPKSLLESNMTPSPTRKSPDISFRSNNTARKWRMLTQKHEASQEENRELLVHPNVKISSRIDKLYKDGVTRTQSRFGQSDREEERKRRDRWEEHELKNCTFSPTTQWTSKSLSPSRDFGRRMIIERVEKGHTSLESVETASTKFESESDSDYSDRENNNDIFYTRFQKVNSPHLESAALKTARSRNANSTKSSRINKLWKKANIVVKSTGSSRIDKLYENGVQKSKARFGRTDKEEDKIRRQRRDEEELRNCTFKPVKSSRHGSKILSAEKMSTTTQPKSFLTDTLALESESMVEYSKLETPQKTDYQCYDYYSFNSGDGYSS